MATRIPAVGGPWNFFHSLRACRQLSTLSTESLAKFFALSHGKRTPTNDPAWITLDVLHGGFASGAHAAALKEDQIKSSEYLKPDKMVELTQQLGTGMYRIEQPENGVLLVAAALLHQNDIQGFSALMEQVAPWLDQLKMYPSPADTPLPSGSLLYLQTVEKSLQQLAKIASPNSGSRTSKRLRQIMHADEVFPLQCKFVELVKETCNDPVSGYPFQHFPKGFVARAKALVEEYKKLSRRPDFVPSGNWRVAASTVPSNGKMSSRFLKKGSTLFNLNKIVEALVSSAADNDESISSKQLDAKTQVGFAKKVIQCHDKAYPEPDRYHNTVLVASKPTFVAELAARIVLERLRHTKEVALDQPLSLSIESFLTAPTGEEIDKFILHPARYNKNAFLLAPFNFASFKSHVGKTKRTKVGSAVPKSVRRCLVRCTEGTMSDLIKQGVIRSNVQLGRAIDRLVASVTASGISDPTLRQLATAITVAFRARRSLLLVDLASQVRVTELPWMESLFKVKVGENNQDDDGDAAVASASVPKEELVRQTLRDVILTNMTQFPDKLWANEFVSALNLVARSGKMKYPLLEEIAADIFMNQFVEKFAIAARMAAKRFQGTLYAKYFNLEESYTELLKMEEDKKNSSFYNEEKVKKEGANGEDDDDDESGNDPLPPDDNTAWENLANGGRGGYGRGGRGGLSRGRGGRYIPETAPATLQECFDQQRQVVLGLLNTRSNDPNGQYILYNRRTIEAVTILTCHNIPQFFEMFDTAVDPAVDLPLEAMAVNCFRTVLRIKSHKIENRRVYFRWAKNAAIAWRQMIAYISLSPTPSTIISALKEVASSPIVQRNENCVAFLKRHAEPLFHLAATGQYVAVTDDAVPDRADKEKRDAILNELPPLPLTAWFEIPSRNVMNLGNNRNRDEMKQPGASWQNDSSSDDDDDTDDVDAKKDQE